MQLKAQAIDLKALEKTLQLFYLNSTTRSPYDKIEIQGDLAILQVWRDLPPRPQKDRLECLGYRWLLTGRGERMGEGAKTVFEKFPELNGLRLEFFELKFAVKSKDGKGALERDVTKNPYLKMEITRERLDRFRIDNDVLKEKLHEDTATCVRLGRRVNPKMEIQL